MSRFVLVHGAWSGTAARSSAAHSLTAAGHQVAAPDLPPSRSTPGQSRAADKTVPPAAQDEMVAGVGGVAAEATLDCGHMAMLADAGGLAAAILRLSA